ncbi:2-hydroxychromene-2-carboxylate isomerase [Mameliella alba]|uniref:2-hydroxychromene-2-carboxylate isomerase n=1 Tax=Mameliella TaxID=1434019 RepID=UPI0008411680|nr:MULTISPECIES: 2-hydroxychromene-2-carboxylate isomerase [Mameliella]ODM50209.1 2-hydroxychromene-2-carboxylate isomerase [Ruegeria sp. PBVC088]MDD9729329.1 2-hydroxychromene-2-carboxylate isomerase [Mameliella sp. AT18]OWV47176.1 2-hydroxychromene-2-carboxylate isomerase [Mameliella alba]PTR38716.1 2-hydroxychromene-2-carboxylate isomerase [Mameliella alba]SDD39970.1 2-hydroxychromene-2-carboxylate isomerase [Mameliella alba]
MAHIDYFFSTISPFSYFAGTRLEEIAAKHGASIAYKPFDIIALFGRTGGVPPGQRHPNRQAYRLQEIERAAKKTGLPVNIKPAHFPTNPAPSSYAVIAAQKAGGGDMGRLVHGLLAACWAQDKDIAEDAVIKACLSEAGFDPSLADTGLLAGAETYPANLEEAVEKGVFGAPTYVVDSGQVFWGNDRLDDLDAHLAGKL